MAYDKKVWSSGDPITITELNNLETQYDEAQAAFEAGDWTLEEPMQVNANISCASGVKVDGVDLSAFYNWVHDRVDQRVQEGDTPEFWGLTLTNDLVMGSGYKVDGVDISATLNQAVKDSSSPTFAGLTVHGDISIDHGKTVDGVDISDLNTWVKNRINQHLLTSSTPEFEGLSVNGDISVSGLVDGTDVSSLDSQVDTIESDLDTLEGEHDTLSSDFDTHTSSGSPHHGKTEFITYLEWENGTSLPEGDYKMPEPTVHANSDNQWDGTMFKPQTAGWYLINYDIYVDGINSGDVFYTYLIIWYSPYHSDAGQVVKVKSHSNNSDDGLSNSGSAMVYMDGSSTYVSPRYWHNGGDDVEVSIDSYMAFALLVAD